MKGEIEFVPVGEIRDSQLKILLASSLRISCSLQRIKIIFYTASFSYRILTKLAGHCNTTARAATAADNDDDAYWVVVSQPLSGACQ